jgi:hypothetical protein
LQGAGVSAAGRRLPLPHVGAASVRYSWQGRGSGPPQCVQPGRGPGRVSWRGGRRLDPARHQQAGVQSCRGCAGGGGCLELWQQGCRRRRLRQRHRPGQADGRRARLSLVGRRGEAGSPWPPGDGSRAARRVSRARARRLHLNPVLGLPATKCARRGRGTPPGPPPPPLLLPASGPLALQASWFGVPPQCDVGMRLEGTARQLVRTGSCGRIASRHRLPHAPVRLAAARAPAWGLGAIRGRRRPGQRTGLQHRVVWLGFPTVGCCLPCCAACPAAAASWGWRRPAVRLAGRLRGAAAVMGVVQPRGCMGTACTAGITCGAR